MALEFHLGNEALGLVVFQFVHSCRCQEGNGRMGGSTAGVPKHVSIMSSAMATPTLHSD